MLEMERVSKIKREERKRERRIVKRKRDSGERNLAGASKKESGEI